MVKIFVDFNTSEDSSKKALESAEITVCLGLTFIA